MSASSEAVRDENPASRDMRAAQAPTTRNRRAWLAWVLWSLVVLQVVLIVAHAVLDGVAEAAASSLDAGAVAYLVIGAISLLVYPLIGAIIFLRRPDHPVGWLFCAANAGWAINNFSGSYVRYALLVKPGSLPAPDFFAWLYTWQGDVSVGITIILCLLVPNGAFLSRRWQRFASLVWALISLAALAQAFAPGPVDSTIGVQINNPAGIGGPLGQVLTVLSGLQVVLVLLFPVAVFSIVLRYRRAQEQERLQIKWIASAFVLEGIFWAAIVPPIIIYSSPAQFPLWLQVLNGLTQLSGIVVPVAMAVAILRHRLYDIDLIIRRTLVYGALTAALALVYWAGVALLQELLRPITGEGNDLAVVATTLAVAALFLPLRRRIQSFIDRRFYRRKYDAARTLEQFGQVARDEVNLISLTARLIGVVQETMQPEHISFWVAAPGLGRRNPTGTTGREEGR